MCTCRRCCSLSPKSMKVSVRTFIYAFCLSSVAITKACTIRGRIRTADAQLNLTISGEEFPDHSITNNSQSPLNLPPHPFYYKRPNFPYLLTFAGFEPPDFSAPDARLFISMAKSHLADTRTTQGALPDSEMPDDEYEFVNTTLAGGMEWVVCQDEEREPGRKLTYVMVETALMGQERLLRYYRPQERVPTGWFLMEERVKNGWRYLADGGMYQFGPFEDFGVN